MTNSQHSELLTQIVEAARRIGPQVSEFREPRLAGQRGELCHIGRAIIRITQCKQGERRVQIGGRVWNRIVICSRTPQRRTAPHNVSSQAEAWIPFKFRDGEDASACIRAYARAVAPWVAYQVMRMNRG